MRMEQAYKGGEGEDYPGGLRWIPALMNCCRIPPLGPRVPAEAARLPTLPTRRLLPSLVQGAERQDPRPSFQGPLLTVGVSPKLAMPQASRATSRTPAGCLQLGLCQCRKRAHISKRQDGLQSLALNKHSWQHTHPLLQAGRSGLGRGSCHVGTHLSGLQSPGGRCHLLRNTTTLSSLFSGRMGRSWGSSQLPVEREERAFDGFLLNSNSQRRPAVIAPITGSKISGPPSSFLFWLQMDAPAAHPRPQPRHAQAQKPHWKVTSRGSLAETGPSCSPQGQQQPQAQPLPTPSPGVPSNFAPTWPLVLELSRFLGKMPAPHTQLGLSESRVSNPHPGPQRLFQSSVHLPTGCRGSDQGKRSPSGDQVLLLLRSGVPRGNLRLWGNPASRRCPREPP